MAFESAVQHLVSAHASQVAELELHIKSLVSQLKQQTDVALTPSGDTYQAHGVESVFREQHQRPSVSPRLAGAGVVRAFLQVPLTTPRPSGLAEHHHRPSCSPRFTGTGGVRSLSQIPLSTPATSPAFSPERHSFPSCSPRLSGTGGAGSSLQVAGSSPRLHGSLTPPLRVLSSTPRESAGGIAEQVSREIDPVISPAKQVSGVDDERKSLRRCAFSDLSDQQYEADACSNGSGEHNPSNQSGWVTLTMGLLNVRLSELTLRTGWVDEDDSTASTKISSWQGRTTKATCPGEISTPLVGMSPSVINDLAALGRIQHDLISKSRAKHVFFHHQSHISLGKRHHSSCCVAHPASNRRAFWICLCLLFVAYETLSLTLAPFEFAIDDLTDVLNWVSAVFWTLDIVATFFTGVYTEGRVEMRLLPIFKIYCQSWLLIDLIVVFMQWYVIYAKAANVHKTAFVFKFLRVVRTLRFGRVVSWVRDETVELQGPVSAFPIIKLFSALLFYIHCNACLWYQVGKARNGWVSHYQGTATEPSSVKHYLIAFHWSLSQLQGNIDIYPGGAIGDRIYSVISSLLSIVALALFVANITDALFQARQKRMRKNSEARVLRCFFNKHEIKAKLRWRAQHFLITRQLRCKAQEAHENDNRALELFPAQLRMHLVGEIRKVILLWHPTFCYLRSFYPNLFLKTCCVALRLRTSEPDEDLFTTGELSSHAYFIEAGEFIMNLSFELNDMYLTWFHQSTVHEDDLANLSTAGGELMGSRISGGTFEFPRSGSILASPAKENGDMGKSSTRPPRGSLKGTTLHTAGRAIQKLRRGKGICEGGLWLSWRHEANLCSLDFGQFFEIGAPELINVLQQNPVPHSVFSSYAQRFFSAAKLLKRQASERRSVLELMTFETVVEIEEGDLHIDDSFRRMMS